MRDALHPSYKREMKNHRIHRFALILLAFLATNFSYSQESTQDIDTDSTGAADQKSQAKPKAPVYKPGGVQFSAGAKSFDYQELGDSGNVIDSEKGVLPAFNLSGTFQQTPDSWFVRGDMDYARGKTRYDGATWGGTPVSRSRPAQILNFEGNLGVVFYSNPGRFYFKGYTGLGYHDWQRGDKESSTDGFYDEDYSWFYFPVGVILEPHFTDTVSAAFELEGKLMFAGKLKGYFSHLNSAFSDVEVGLGGKPGFKASLPFTLKLSDNLSLRAGPWFEYSAIGKSNIGTVLAKINGTNYSFGVMEPDSVTYQFGLNAGLLLTF